MCCECFLIDETRHTYTVTGEDCSGTSEPIFNILGIFCSFLGRKERYCYSEIIMNSRLLCLMKGYPYVLQSGP
jgi:hypothetical protein